MSNTKKILAVSFQSLTQESAGGMARLGYYLSKVLHDKKLLKKFVIYSKGKFETSFPSEPVSGWAKYLLFILNKANKIIKLPDYKFRLIQEHLFDILCTQHITNDISILFTTNAHLKRTFKKAKSLGIRIVYVPANPEENYIYELISKENELLGITDPDPYTYQPRLKFYNESIIHVETVIGTYPTVYDSYQSANRAYDIIKINGHLKPDFSPYTLENRDIKKPLNVIYIASSVPLKGLQYLLEAWEDIMQTDKTDDIQLNIVGNIEEVLNRYLTKRFKRLKNVRFSGRVPDVSEELKKADLCVVPSLTDGGPYVALEAAHFGVPVVLTENCGSAELLSRNPTGCITISIRDSTAIKDAILWVKENREDARQLGINAKQQLDKYSMTPFITNIGDYLELEHNKLIN